MIPLIVGAALGLAKAAEDQDKEKRERVVSAAQARWSPWTHMTPDKVNQASPMGDIGQGIYAGAQFQAQNPNMFGGAAAPAAAGGQSLAPPAAGQIPNQNYMDQRYPFAAQQQMPQQSNWLGVR